MNSVRAIQKLNKRELEEAITPEGSWHADYRDTAFINIGGLPFELSEGDIITIFSQYGEPVWVKLARDKETGKSRGFAWLKYEDQRSCDLAVDNLGGATVMDRVLRVDHARYKPRDDEDMRDNTMGELDLDPDNDSDDARRKRRRTESESDSDDRPLLPEEIELEKAIENLDEEDPMKESLVKRLQEKADTAVKKYMKSRRKEKERKRKHEKRHRRDGSRHRDRSRDRRNIRGREESEDENRHRSPRRHRKNSRERKHDSQDRHHSRERRHYSSEEDNHRRSRSNRSPRPSKDDHRRRDDDRHKARSGRDAR